MNSSKEFERIQLIEKLRSCRIRFGRDSEKVFKIIKEIKRKYPYNHTLSADDWAIYSLRNGSFSHLNIK